MAASGWIGSDRASGRFSVCGRAPVVFQGRGVEVGREV